MLFPFSSWSGGFALLLLVALATAVWWVGWRAVRLALAELPVTLALARTIDGRHALGLAWGLRHSAHKLRRALQVVHDDASQRAALQVTLEHFTGAELSDLLRRLHILIATGDNDRVRALNRRLEECSAQWATLSDGPERQRLDAAMAQFRQQMEESRRTSRVWVALIRSLEETGASLKSLERDLALYGVSRQGTLPDFRLRLAEVSTHIQTVQQARRELEAAR